MTISLKSKNASQNGAPLPDTHIAILAKMYADCARLDVRVLHGGFSGAVVLLVEPTDVENRPVEPSVVKIDKVDSMTSEKEKMEEMVERNLLGENSPSPIDFTIIDSLAGLAIELCGAQWSIPGFMNSGG